MRKYLFPRFSFAFLSVFPNITFNTHIFLVTSSIFAEKTYLTEKKNILYFMSLSYLCLGMPGYLPEGQS